MSEATKYFNITEEDKNKARKVYQKSENDIKTDLIILNEWWKKQQHLPKNNDDNRLERMHLRNKFRIEQTKIKIDNYYTLKGLYPDFFEDVRSNFDAVIEHRNQFVSVPLPKLGAKGERIIVCKIVNKDAPISWKKVFTQMLVGLDLQFSHDYSDGDRVIADWTNITFAHYKTLDLNVLLKGMAIHQEAYSGRLTGIDYVNAPAFIDMLLNILKMALKPKLFGKIKIHKDLESLHKTIAKDYLPSDFGGKLESIDFYNKKFNDILISEKEFLIENIKMTSDESKRIGEPYANNLFGMDGTFKKLNLD